MSTIDTDIDIDFADRDLALKHLSHIPATEMRHGLRAKHKTGVYFQDIPIDPLDQSAVYEYQHAKKFGYFKLDFLNLSMYRSVRDEAHLDDLANREPDWNWFTDLSIVEQLNQIKSHFDVVVSIRPRSVTDLAVCIALLRPGKRHLIGRPRYEIDHEIWTPNADGYSFKKSHSFAYALSVIVQVNLLMEDQADDLIHIPTTTLAPRRCP